MNDIVVTGLGLVSSIGIGRKAFWENVKKANSGIKKITFFDTDSFDCNMAAWIDNFDAGRFLKPQIYRRMSRASRMAVVSSIEAIDDSGLSLEDIDKNRIGIVMGTSYGGSSCIDEFYMSFLENGPRGAQPFLFPETVPNAPASHIAIFHRLTGPNTTFSQNEISSEIAIMYAQNLLAQNYVDVVLLAGADELSPIQFSCYNALGALNKVRVEGGESVMPDPGRGLVLGEGAGVLIMENADFARKRGAKIYGSLRSGVLSGGTTAIGHYEIDGKQATRTAMAAIGEAGMDSSDIDHVSLSANFSRELDRVEYGLLQKAFPNRNHDLTVSPLKYLIGNFGGAGVARAAAILLAFNYEKSLPGIKPEALLGKRRQTLKWITNHSKLKNALMTTTTFGGGTASMIWSKY